MSSGATGGNRQGSLAMGAGNAWRGNPRGVAEIADGTDSGHHADGPDMFRSAHATGQPSFVKT